MKRDAKDSKKLLVLLDAHAIIHRAYHALPEFSSSKGEPTGALYGLSTMLINIVKQFEPDYVVAAFDLPGPTYRHEAYKDYKAGRKKGDDNLIAQLNRAREVFEAFNIPIYDKPGFEADDILGTIVERMSGEKNIEIVIASGDMDTMQLIDKTKVKVFTLKKGIKDTVTYDEKAVVERFGFAPEYLPDYKGLRGDPSDNIPGVHGIGEKTATAIISKYKTIEKFYKALTKSKEEVMKETGITERVANLLLENEEEAIFSKTLATIRRDAPIEFSLPERSFKEGLDLEKINRLFEILEFRSLPERVKSILGGENEVVQNIAKQDFDPELVEECSVLLWTTDSNIITRNPEEILRYSKAKTLEEAREKLLKEIDSRNQTRVWREIEEPLMKVVKSMKEVGIKIDAKFLEKLSKDYHKKLAEIESEIYKQAGREFNVNSPKQLGEVLFTELGLQGKRQKKTAGGALSTKESELLKIKDLHPIVPLILEQRELQKLLSTYIDVFLTLLDKDSRVHPTFLQNGSTTGRMASENPAIQNIPIKSELGRNIRYAFVAEEGFNLVAIDYSQMELRIAAFLSGDPKLIEIFKHNRDVHTEVASQVFKVPREEVDKEMRRKAKVINFGILYGMGVNALRENLGGTREEAQNFYNEYFATFTQLSEYLENIKKSTAERGYTETFFGRRRYIQGMNSSLPYVRSIAERAAINAPIQGTEADVIKLAMVRIHEFLEARSQKLEARMLLQVHDELVFEVKEGSEDEIVPKLREIMESVISPQDASGIILTTEASVGKNWGEMKKI